MVRRQDGIKVRGWARWTLSPGVRGRRRQIAEEATDEAEAAGVVVTQFGGTIPEEMEDIRKLPGVGAYRNGWLALSADGPVFLFYRRFQPRTLLLPLGEVAIERGFWADLARVTTTGARYAIYFLKDGPAPELALAPQDRPTTTVP